MPRLGTTMYDLLISCPSDVESFVDVIKGCVETFNHTIGIVNNAAILTKHWRTDSYPQSGEKPQEILNNQVVRDCDAAIAIFWTRFGSPTGKFDSGTEEEIEEMLSLGKQVFLYFVDAPIDPSKIDMKQYQQVKDFKEKYQSRGLYSIVKDENELRKQFTNHITMYFLPLMMGCKGEVVIQQASPKITIKGMGTDEDNHAFVEQTDFVHSKFLLDKKDSILLRLNELQDKHLSPRKQKEAPISPKVKVEHENAEINKVLEYEKLISGKVANADIPVHWKDVITNFAEKNNVVISTAFWNIGELKKRESLVALDFVGEGTTLDGSDEEKNRYDQVEMLYWDIVCYNEYENYFTKIDEQKRVALVLTNTGTTFDEDIDVKIFVNKNSIIKWDEMAVPSINIIEDLLKMKFIEFCYKIENSPSIDAYSGYPIKAIDFDYRIPMPFSSASADYKKHKEKHANELEHIFCYQYYQTDEYDILQFHVNYLKHNTQMAFPSVLAFKELQGTVNYEITSKHVSSVVKGTLEIET